MATRGPKPKLKLAGSEPTTRRTNQRPVIVLPPFELGHIAMGEWERYAPILVKAKRLDDTNAPAFAYYCEVYEMYMKARSDCEVMSIITDSGGVKANPAVAVAFKAMDMMIKILKEFGVTPASLKSLGQAAVAETKVDQLSEFVRNT